MLWMLVTALGEVALAQGLFMALGRVEDSMVWLRILAVLILLLLCTLPILYRLVGDRPRQPWEGALVGLGAGVLQVAWLWAAGFEQVMGIVGYGLFAAWAVLAFAGWLAAPFAVPKA